ncbi:MAG TPA: hypothetical protein VN690_14345 [Terriglobales bacterium]|nr:hypothetical protein [Terriglobales bacterium]
MPLLKRSLHLAPPPAGILASRLAAHPALLRILSRARRQQAPLVLLRVAPDPAASAGDDRHRRFLEALAAEVRVSDLVWWEPGAVVMLMLESARAPHQPLARLRRLAQLEGARPRWGAAQFPEQGLTLQALLEAARPEIT